MEIMISMKMSSSRKEFVPSRIKYKWSDGEGRLLSAGGLLPYDEHGVWVIEERRNGGPLEWNDIGGKYEPEDGDIYATISREFCEELYNSTDGCLTRNILKRWVKSGMCKVAYVNGYRKQPVYVAYCVNVGVLKTVGIKLDPEKFEKRRNKIILQNPHVPEVYYGAVKLRYILFDNIPEECGKMSYRLRKVIEPITPSKYVCHLSQTKEETIVDRFTQISQEVAPGPSTPREHKIRKKHRTPYFFPRDRTTYNRKIPLQTFTPKILKRGEKLE